MTNETRERIKYYMNQLPHMKEKLAAAIIMLVIAASVTVTATYAWITLSTAPEATSIDTTVAANGSLEIALANGTGSAPGKSREGDSSAAEGTNISAANITWGNLVNLSDPSYGLSKITLRPAALNGTTGLLSDPLYGVGYGEDGRVSNMVTDDDFAYVYFDTESEKFLVDMDDNHLGVRAISTVKYENLEGDNTFAELLGLVNQNFALAKSNYTSMTNEEQEPGKSYIASLQGLIETYAQKIVIESNSTKTVEIKKQYVSDLYEMMKYFRDSVMMPVGECYVQMANLLELLEGSGKSDAGYNVETLVAASKAGTLPDYIKENLKGLASYADDYVTLSSYLKTSAKGDYTDLSDSEKTNSLAYWAHIANGANVYWSNIDSHINWICDINSATLNDHKLSSLRNMSVANSILNAPSPRDAKIYNGAICRMEKRLGQKMGPIISVTVDATSIVNLQSFKNVKLDARLTTVVEEPFDIIADRELVKSLNKGSFKGDTPTAEDTYAMAVDLWVRTNAGSNDSGQTEEVIEKVEDGKTVTTVVTTSTEKAYLTLEGAVKFGTEEKQATVTDIHGDTQPAYTASVVIDGMEQVMDVFRRYDKYYFMDEGNEVELEAYLKESYGTVPEITYVPKMIQQNVVIGYEGVNRVWTEEQMAGFEADMGTVTTQGGGSCYVFYANNPADQGRFLDLLDSMKVVFVNEQGRQIGAAYMDTKNYFAETGKVTVPLVLDKTQAIKLGTDTNGNEIYGMMALEKNAATRITALVYLDGNRLKNDMVLASGDIQGTLNIQFGSSSALVRTTTTTETGSNGETIVDKTVDYITGSDNEAIEDEKVMSQYVKVSANISNNSFEYDPANPAKATLTVTVEGMEPKTVDARFMRAISSTQGVLLDAVSLSGSGANWNTMYTFDKPGNYVLRSVWIDGAEYTLSESVEVTVVGSSVNSVTCDAITDGSGFAAIMTASNSFSTKMTLGFTSSKAIPNRVNGIFEDEDNKRQVIVPFILKDGVWTGNAKFTTSGTYTMKYVEIDGNTDEIKPESLQPTLQLLLGLKARTWITASDDTLTELQKDFPTALATNFIITKDVPLQVAVEIYDNSGNPLKGLSDVKLYYGRSGSSILANGLDSNLRWDNSMGQYVGDFNVTKAGTYKFRQVTVGNNVIENFTIAPNIQAMPPEDAYYFDNYTEEYQYSPNFDAAMILGIAYSNAASRIEATITNGLNTYTDVEGKIVPIPSDEEQVDFVDAWTFTLPKNGDDGQEGEWHLKGITMYGVYYDGNYYAEDGAGIYIDLSKENIYTQVINYLRVTLSGSDTEFISDEEQKIYNCFMDENSVTGLKVKIADYQGKPVKGLEISDVKVVYRLDLSKENAPNLDNYGYETDSAVLQAVAPSGDGLLIDGTETEYDISGLKLQMAGLYNNCTVSFKAGGDNFTAGGTGTILRYEVNGSPSEDCPQYEVRWKAPTVKITGTNPAANKKFNVNIGNMSGNAMARETYNYISENGDYVRLAAECEGILLGYTTVTWPKMTLTLSNAGAFSDATLSVPNAASKKDVDFNFTPSKLSVEETIGSSETMTRQPAGYQEISKITMNYGTISVTMNLEHKIVVNEAESAIGRLEYKVSASVENPPKEVELPYRTNKVVLSAVANYEEKLTEDGVEGSPINVSTETETVYYRKGLGNYQTYKLSTVISKIPYTGAVYNVTYKITGWIITREDLVGGTSTVLNGGKAYAPGTEVSLSEGSYHYVAEPVTEELSRTYIGEATQYKYIATTTWSGPSRNVLEPSGTKYSDQSKTENYLNSKVGEEFLYWKDN